MDSFQIRRRTEAARTCRFQARRSTTVEEYKEALQNGAKFPPIVTFFDGVYYYLADGWHRYEAYVAAGIVDIQADVYEGTRRDAQMYAFGANASHGLRRTNEDKRRSVSLMLDDEEWSGWTDNAIASACRVSNHLVTKIRSNRERSGAAVTWNVPSEELESSTEHMNSDGETGSATAGSSAAPASKSSAIGSVENDTRSRKYVTKHGTESVMKTANIGRSRNIEPTVAYPVTVAERATVVKTTTPVVETTTLEPDETVDSDDPSTLAGFNTLWNNKPQVSFASLLEASRDVAWYREQFAEIMRILDVDDETMVVDMIRTLAEMAKG